MDILKENEGLLRFMATQNSHDYNVKKVVEECTELTEAVIKRDTKSKGSSNRPSKKDVINEYGDVILRGIVIIMEQNPDLTISQILNQVSYHITDKINSLKERKKICKYKNEDRL